MKTIKKILVPIDMSVYSYYALDYALDLAEMYLYDTEITLLHVLDKSSITMYSNLYVASNEIFGDIEGDAHKAIKNELEKHDKTKLCKVKISIEVLWGNPYKEIVDFAEEKNKDIIIMASHTKRAISRFFLGSVAEKVVRYSSTPVLIIRPEEMKVIEKTDIENELHLSS